MVNIIISIFFFCVGALTMFMQLMYPIKGQMLSVDGVIIYLASVVCCIGAVALYTMSCREYRLSKLQTKKFGQTR